MTDDRSETPPVTGDADRGAKPGMAESPTRAEAVIAKLAAQYPTIALKDVADCQAALDAARAEPVRRCEHLRRLYGIAHNIKGQGGSFDYPLVTRIGQSLCRFIAEAGEIELQETELPIVQAHLDALKLILEQRISGEGGETATKLAERLESLTHRDA
jgi:hypothetical protein